MSKILNKFLKEFKTEYVKYSIRNRKSFNNGCYWFISKLKRIYRILVVLVLVQLMIGCSQIEMMKKFNSGKPLYNDKINTIPFTLDGHRIFVDVELNGRKKLYKFIVDTGALTMLSSETACELGLEMGIEIPTIKDGQSANLSHVNSIKIGDVIVNNLIVPVMDINKTFGNSLEINGFIGSDFLRFYRTQINYKNNELVISKDKTGTSNEPKLSTEMEVSFPLRFPEVLLNLNNCKGIESIIDTGSPYALVLPLGYVDKFSKETQLSFIKSNGPVVKWPGTTADYNYITNIKNLQFGEVSIYNVPVLFAELPKMFNKGLIGKSLIEKLDITLDYPMNKLLMESDKNIKYVTHSLETGIGLSTNNNGNIIIRGVWEKSPADKCGLKPGCIITEVNSLSTEQMSLKDIYEIFENDSIKTVNLNFTQDGVSNNVDITKENMFDVR